MRKLVSLGILALLMSVLAGPVVAGVDACDTLKLDKNAPKGLYGLCVAYWSAENGRGQDRVEQLYDRKAIAAGYPPGIPGLVVSPQEPDPVSCPCWGADKLAEAYENGTPLSCSINDDEIGIEFVIYGENEEAVSYQFHAEDALCLQKNPDGTGTFQIYDRDTTITEEDKLKCRDGIHVLVEMSFNNSCD